MSSHGLMTPRMRSPCCGIPPAPWTASGGGRVASRSPRRSRRRNLIRCGLITSASTGRPWLTISKMSPSSPTVWRCAACLRSGRANSSLQACPQWPMRSGARRPSVAASATGTMTPQPWKRSLTRRRRPWSRAIAISLQSCRAGSIPPWSPPASSPPAGRRTPSSSTITELGLKAMSACGPRNRLKRSASPWSMRPRPPPPSPSDS